MAKAKATPTGGTDAGVADGRGKGGGAKAKAGGDATSSSGKKVFNRTFAGGTSKRELRMELLGESTPGPGAYLPASTFARAASSSSFHRGKTLPATTSVFRSKSVQRAHFPADSFTFLNMRKHCTRQT